MRKERGCARNHWMRGGGTATFTSPAGMVQPGFYPEIKVIDSCSVARPGMVQVTPKGLMGGGRRRSKRMRHSRRIRKMRGGTYKMDLTGQGMQPNQFAEVVKIPCGQKGGAPFIEMPSVGYGNKGELVTSESGNMVPVMMQQPYNNTLGLSSACKQTGGKKSRRRRASRKTRRRNATRRRAH